MSRVQDINGRLAQIHRDLLVERISVLRTRES